jgi:hypothetical protein
MISRREWLALSASGLCTPLLADDGVWPSQPPADCPFAPSTSIRGLAFTGRQASYTTADT